MKHCHFLSNYARLFAATAVLSFALATPTYAQYAATILPSVPGVSAYYAYSISNGTMNPNNETIAGEITNPPPAGQGETTRHSVIWSGDVHSFTVLDNTTNDSVAYGVSVYQQGADIITNITGYTYGLSPTARQVPMATLWNVGSNSLVNSTNLSPYFSVANGVYHNVQVGIGTNFTTYDGGLDTAALWQGTASSILQLQANPSGIGTTSAYGISKTIKDSQKFYNIAGSNPDLPHGIAHYRALLWVVPEQSVLTANVNECVLPNPPDLIGDAEAFGVCGDQKVGYGSTPLPKLQRAVIWDASNIPTVIHPNLMGFNQSILHGTNGNMQVGYVFNSVDGGGGFEVETLDSHAGVWQGSADSFIDLHKFLPVGFSRSQALGIDESGNIVGYGTDERNNDVAVLWQLGQTKIFLSGTIALDGVTDLSATNPLVPVGNITFQFFPANSTTHTTPSIIATAPLIPVGNTNTGTYDVSVTPGIYDIGISSGKSLRAIVKNVNATASVAISDVTTLLGGNTNALTSDPGNNIVDFDDFLTFLNAFGSQVSDPASGFDPQADFNYDGLVNFDDFLILLNNFGVVGDL